MRLAKRREDRALDRVVAALETLVTPIQLAPAPGSHTPLQVLPLLIEPLRESPIVQKPSPSSTEKSDKQPTPQGDAAFFVEPDFAPILAKAIAANLNVLLVGPSGCVAGDAHIAFVIRDKNGRLINKKGGSLATLYRRFNAYPQHTHGPKWKDAEVTFYVQSVTGDGVVRRNKIERVVDSGQKMTYQVTTASGFSLKATADHEFMVSNGYRALELLSVGDEITVSRGKVKAQGRRRHRPYRQEVLVKKHPTATTKIVNGCTYYRTFVYRAVVEAHLNGMSYADYISTLNNADDSIIKSLKTIPPGCDVHHLDENVENNNIDNLAIIDSRDHLRQHHGDGPKIFVESDRIVSITPVGIEQVYDIVCAEPYRNFLANGIAVHNCGKSSLLERLANRIDKNKPAVVSLHGEWSADDFFGGKEAKDGSTYDRYGIATIAMMQRRRLIIHEFDAAPAEILFSLQRVLEKEALVLTQFADDNNVPLEINPWVPLDYDKKMPDGSVRKVRRQPKFSILATANTLGHGDDTGLYRGTKVLNHSTLDRFDLIKTMSYPAKEIEATILRKRTGLDEINAHRITQVAEMARKAAGAGLEARKLLAPITMRQTLGWAQLIARLGCSPGQAFIFTVSDRSPPDERKMLAEIFNLAFGKDPTA